jgi:hypothetical protein
VLSYDKATGTYLTPGTYLPFTPLSQSELNTIYPQSSINITSIHVGVSLVVLPPAQPVMYTENDFAGDLIADAWRSAYFPPGFYGLVAPGQALWGSIPRSKELREISPAIKRLGLGTPSVKTETE